MSNARLVFVISRSRTLMMVSAMLCVLALISAFYNRLQITLKLGLAFFILLHFAWQWRQYQNKPQALLAYNDTEGWSLAIGDKPFPIEILPSTVLTTFLIIVHYRSVSANKRSSSTLLCCKDALTFAAFRQLTVQLKIAGLSTQKHNT